MPSFRSCQPSTPFPILALVLMVTLGACGDDGDGTTEPENDAPTAVAGADTSFERGLTLALDGSASSDPDAEDELSFAWSVQSRPAGSTVGILNASSANASFEPDLAGTYVVRLAVSDGDASDTDELEIEVTFPVIDAAIDEDRVLTNSAAHINEPDYLIPADQIIQVTATLTIEPGVTIQMGQNSRLQFVDGGVIVAAGTADLPIRFRGSSATPGWHEGLQLAVDSLDNLLDHVEIAHGGRDGWANLWVDGSVTLTNSMLRDSGTYGLHLGGTLNGFANNDFIQNTISGIRIGPDEVHWIDAASTVSNNGGPQRIHIFDGDVLTAQTWASDHAYVLEPFAWIHIRNTLTLDPGFDLMVAENGRVQVEEGGTLIAVGTATDSIRFFSDAGGPGRWDGIHVEPDDTHSQISFARVGEGGRIFANIYTNGTLSVTNSHIHDSAGNGIHQSSSGSLTHGENTFENIAGEEVLIID